jgi:hypothetical protein
MNRKIDRRTFLRAGLAGTAGLRLGWLASTASSLEARGETGKIPKRSLGRTWYKRSGFQPAG